ncbi:MAG: FAD/NAD(P)-binding protein [Sphingomonas bacterium]
MTGDVAIVGAGFSGTLLAINLLRHDGPRATLIERAPVAGTGVAYGTAHRDHVLNVRAANMSAFPDQPDHFVAWLRARGHTQANGAFVSRALYGEYLRALLQDARRSAPDRLRLIADDAIDIHDGDTMRDTLASGRAVAAGAAVLAVGNLPPHLPAAMQAVKDSPRYRPNPWDASIADGLEPGDTMLLIGTGLTMIDVVLTLHARGFPSRIVALSRRGLIPHRHAPVAPNDAPLAERPRGPLSALTRTVRRRGEAIGWRNAVDELRRFTHAIWAQADAGERERFLRHLRPWWDIHRHRLAPPVADRIAALVASGQLSVHAGKLGDAIEREDGIAVTWHARGATRPSHLVAQRVVNCTGPQGDLSRTDEPLLARLVARGAIRPDAEHLGIDVDARGRTIAADGQVNDSLYAIGPMTRGAFWETVAVPDIRRQAWDLARTLSNAQWVEGEEL